MTYSDQIGRALEQFHSYLSRNLASCERHPAARVSSFWAEHFADRSNFPDISGFLAFRRGDFVYGIGDTGPATPDRKRREFDDVYKSMLHLTPSDFIDRLREPTLGAPLIYSCGKANLSASYVLNSGTTWRISELARHYGHGSQPLNVCEIGAGWGACASQLHQVCNIASYTIVDLPENLCLSSTYLSMTLPDRQAGFIECGPGTPIAPALASLNFALPPAIDNLSGPYQVIINTMSFQEMDSETVKEYFRWAARVLAPGGLLMSFNAHDKAGIRRPSEYLHDGLRLVHMAPFRKLPAGYFNTIPYEMVFRREDSRREEISASAVDALGEMIQLGLDDNLRELSEGVTTGSSHEISYLTSVRDFFYADDEQQRRMTLGLLLKQDDCITHFLAGNYWYAQGNMSGANEHLRKSLSLGLRDFAAVRARVLLAALYDGRPEASLSKDAGGLAAEIASIIGQHDVAGLRNHIARVMDCPVETRTSWRELRSKMWRHFARQPN